jgi:hypothetical protein
MGIRSSRQSYNTYMRKYMLKRYRVRRRKAILLLGGECVRCGSKKGLQFDHMDPKSRTFAIAKRGSSSEEKFWREVKKCQLLCGDCHLKKTLEENGWTYHRGEHGTAGGYRYCGPPACEPCQMAWREYQRRWREGKYGKRNPRPVPDHGVDARYQRNCRCRLCKAAHAKTMRNYRRSKL